MSELSARVRATRLVLELLVVVAGILIAFSLDAWWSRRAHTQMEQDHLRALRSDFGQNVARLSELIDREERVANASRRLLVASLSSDRRSTEDSLSHLLGQVFNSSRFDPVMGAYEAVVASGGLAQIRSDSLRLALADFASFLDGRYQERFADQLYFDFIRTFTGQLGIASAVVSDSVPAASVLAPDAGLLQDPRFREHLGLRYSAETGVAGMYRGLLEKASLVLDLTNRAIQ